MARKATKRICENNRFGIKSNIVIDENMKQQQAKHGDTSEGQTSNYLQAGYPSCRPTNIVRAAKEKASQSMGLLTPKLTYGSIIIVS